VAGRISSFTGGSVLPMKTGELSVAIGTVELPQSWHGSA